MPAERVRWLGRESLEIPVRQDVSVLLNWTARIDWTGGIEENVGVSSKGVPEKAHKQVAGVFNGLRRKKGILKAVEGVMQVLQET